MVMFLQKSAMIKVICLNNIYCKVTNLKNKYKY